MGVQFESTMIKSLQRFAVVIFIPLSMLILSSSLTYAIQYSTECRVEANGKEVCKERRITEVETQPLPKPPPAFKEETPFELGGLLVIEQNNLCQDEIDTCDDIIGSEKDEWCTNTALGVRDRCRLTCGACTATGKTENVFLKRTTIGVAQSNGGQDNEIKKTTEILAEMVRYLREEVLVEKGYENMYKLCVNTHELCAFWASLGECVHNPDYMKSGCTLACKTCHEHKGYVHITV